MTLIQKYFVPEEIAEAKKWTIYRLAQVTVTSAIRRRPAATSGERSTPASPCMPRLSVTVFGEVEAKSPRRLSFSPTHITELPANRKQLLLPGIFEDNTFKNISFSLSD